MHKEIQPTRSGRIASLHLPYNSEGNNRARHEKNLIISLLMIYSFLKMSEL